MDDEKLFSPFQKADAIFDDFQREAIEAETAYRLLLILQDQCSAAIHARLDDLSETAFQYDDESVERGMIEWNLAKDYLFGENGLSQDLLLAREHFKSVIEQLHSFESAQEWIEEVSSNADQMQREVLNEISGSIAEILLINQVKRVSRLRTVSAPQHILDMEMQMLHELFDKFSGTSVL